MINLTTATEFALFEEYGETEDTLPELEQIRNAMERARVFYNRLYGLLLRIAESQPVVSLATLRLFEQSIDLAQATADAVEATVQETKKTWGLI